MKEFIKKQKAFKRLRNALIIITAVVFVIYITFEPALVKRFQNTTPFQFALFALVLVVLAIVFLYETKYAKAEAYLADVQNQISDAAYYLTSREEKTIEDYAAAVRNDLAQSGYKIIENVTANDFTFNLAGIKLNEYFYVVKLGEADKNDIISYTDAAVWDIANQRMKRKGDGVVLFICDNAEENAVALSKTFTKIQTGRRAFLTVYPAIAELNSGKVYFLGNKISRAQKMIANYVMNCDLPLKEKYIGDGKLDYQLELEEKMKHFDGKI